MQTIHDVPTILRREIEALYIAPFLDAFAKELGWEKTREIAAGVIGRIAEQAGKDAAPTPTTGGFVGAGQCPARNVPTSGL